jgi:hypothetical protein
MTYEQALKTNWILDGKTVRGYYCGILVEGLVEDSRVKYGTDIQYRVKLQTPYNFFGVVRDIVLIDGSNITEVF